MSSGAYRFSSLLLCFGVMRRPKESRLDHYRKSMPDMEKCCDLPRPMPMRPFKPSQKKNPTPVFSFFLKKIKIKKPFLQKPTQASVARGGGRGEK